MKIFTEGPFRYAGIIILMAFLELNNGIIMINVTSISIHTNAVYKMLVYKRIV